MKTKGDFYIKLLKYVRDNPNITQEQLQQTFPDYYFTINNEIIFNKILVNNDPNGNIPKYILSFEDRFKLLEHEELEHAKKSSKNAMWIAIISILLTLATLAWSIFIPQTVRVLSS